MINIKGTYECKVDSKGRFMFPYNFKKQLESKIEQGFIIKRSVFDKCLEFYPDEVWEKELEQINGLNRFIKENNKFITAFMSGHTPVDLDNSGRILIPKHLMEYAGIKTEKDKNKIILVSAIDRINIWDKEEYTKEISNLNKEYSELAEKVMGNKNRQKENDYVSQSCITK